CGLAFSELGTRADELRTSEFSSQPNTGDNTVKNHRSLLITASLLMAAAFVGVVAQTGTGATPALTNLHPQQMASASPSPGPT
ncbi:MAG TPA: hypothetical protein VGP41_07810, partial [Candidatus Lustribacter sp.]|nr:hypothetical protein [Candidatus Lustribacter sp.]